METLVLFGHNVATAFLIVPMNKENKIQKERMAITGERLVEIFTSKKFWKALQRVERRVRKSGIEDGFEVFITPDSTGFKIVRTLRPVTPYEAILTERTSKEYHKLIEEEGIFPIIETHFHPESSFGYRPIDVVPSREDLLFLGIDREIVRDEGFDVRPIGGIAHGIGVGKLRLMLFQRRSNVPLVTSQETEEYNRDIEYARTFSEILETLRAYGYKAEVIEIHSGRISPQDQAKIKNFSFEVNSLKFLKVPPA